MASPDSPAHANSDAHPDAHADAQTQTQTQTQRHAASVQNPRLSPCPSHTSSDHHDSASEKTGQGDLDLNTERELEIDPEKAHGYADGHDEEEEEEDEGGFAPIKPSPSRAADSTTTTPGNQLLRVQSSTARRQRSWSISDGYSLHNAGDAEGDAGGMQETGMGMVDGHDPENSDSRYVVQWEEADLMNPRTMKTGRKWMIVVIVSLGSLCVYVSWC